ncbi:glutathione S-transferase family protein [Marinomonas mediterranea]|uniref:Glutathione S-transferase domain n=1 Tax=Marinomonas mediterranea (strain ATCC 700492 / JCM 21426 / NBRC 103028 / MMB-1) TaxID=717774 RepID=F2JXP1_MARM1|nr:glutathione S-transferase family protein [Marinomonas mediterranea]ADZ93039.1 Glutathione S-transferase domain [Marinomonas mediterranea MMB-1]WCN10948.1 glutathione S-transferase [Marinomonas mediterranea]WCN15010.1 glutathione S-transferase [Marinomonas mediterranea]WCN19054.1 glutathione S-transferase [Marinomonas mediterranea MMB-1]
MKLIIGNKNYSSWSLRGWLALKLFDVPFEEIQLELFSDEFFSELAKYSPVKKVPVLVDGDISVWDSLSICEYINEQYLEGAGWPSDKGLRAKARSVVAEMHSSYVALRSEMPMNCRARKVLTLSEAAQKDIWNIDSLWAELLSSHKGKFLFGDISLADAFFAPVVYRFNTYGVSLSEASKAYLEAMLALPQMQEWLEGALAEGRVIDSVEVGEPVNN